MPVRYKDNDSGGKFEDDDRRGKGSQRVVLSRVSRRRKSISEETADELHTRLRAAVEVGLIRKPSCRTSISTWSDEHSDATRRRVRHHAHRDAVDYY